MFRQKYQESIEQKDFVRLVKIRSLTDNTNNIKRKRGGPGGGSLGCNTRSENS